MSTEELSRSSNDENSTDIEKIKVPSHLIRIGTYTKIPNVIKEALFHFDKGEKEVILLSMGNSIGKLVVATEYLKVEKKLFSKYLISHEEIPSKKTENQVDYYPKMEIILRTYTFEDKEDEFFLRPYNDFYWRKLRKFQKIKQKNNKSKSKNNPNQLKLAINPLRRNFNSQLSKRKFINKLRRNNNNLNQFSVNKNI